MRSTTAGLLFLVCALAPRLALAEVPPQQVIQTLSDHLLEVMRHAQDLGFKGRSDSLRPAVDEAYDMPAMTREALGPSSAKLSPDQMRQLIAAFDRYTVATYAAQFDGYDGERFEVGVPRPSTAGAVVVPSRILPRTGDPTEIDYLMRQDSQGQWRIVDVLLDGTVSQVAVRRSEFTSLYRNEGFTKLVQMLDQKSVAMETP